MQNRLADKAGNGYDLQVHPVVDNVEPTQGSKAGGTLVTLTGRGFPHIAPREGNSSDSAIDIVLPGGSRCETTPTVSPEAPPYLDDGGRPAETYFLYLRSYHTSTY